MGKQIYYAKFSWRGGWQYKNSKTSVKLYPQVAYTSFVEGTEKEAWNKVLSKYKSGKSKQYIAKNKDIQILEDVGKTVN